ncbi:MAG TPA: hypothetical protein PKD27_08395, partial [Tepidiformaceae bacterium]|nr:hypothetical protein [Tepidiformaceae bacterium]
MAQSPTLEPAFDPDALRKKYQEEREKRLRADGNNQYIQIAGEFARYADDPYAKHIEREPLTDEVEVAIIGGGFALGARLREAGGASLRIIDHGGNFGGTWYWNRYPGAACDTEAYIYLPLLEETGYIPTEKYAKGNEIFEHSKRIAEHYNLYDNACLQTGVTGLEWDDRESHWIIS